MGRDDFARVYGAMTAHIPKAAPVQGRDGDLYGTTYGGGPYGWGARVQDQHQRGAHQFACMSTSIVFI